MRDPRYSGLILLAVFLGAGFVVLNRSHLAPALSGALTAVVALAVIGAIALPVWRDEKYPVHVAGIVLVSIGLVGLLIAVIVGFGFGVS